METVVTSTRLLKAGDMVRPLDNARFFQIVAKINPGTVEFADGSTEPSSTVWERVIELG